MHPWFSFRDLRFSILLSSSLFFFLVVVSATRDSKMGRRLVQFQDPLFGRSEVREEGKEEKLKGKGERVSKLRRHALVLLLRRRLLLLFTCGEADRSNNGKRCSSCWGGGDDF